MKGEIGLVLAAVAVASLQTRTPQDGAAPQSPASAPAAATAGAPSATPVSGVDPSAPSTGDTADAPVSSPVAAPRAAAQEPQTLDARLRAIDARLVELRAIAVRIEAGEEIDLRAALSDLGDPPVDADQRTRRLREEVSRREEDWTLARAAREKALSEARTVMASQTRIGPRVPSGPFSHPLAVPDDFRIGLVHFRTRDYERSAAHLARVSGAEARYFEGRAHDALDHIEEALRLYGEAKAQAAGNTRLLGLIERSKAGCEWKAKFGRPEDLGVALRPKPSEEAAHLADSLGKDAKPKGADTAGAHGGGR